MEIRGLRDGDLEEVSELADHAFIGVLERLSGQRLGRPFFPIEGLRYRLDADPDGCLVAEADGRLTGVLFSVRRGTLAWFGPLAVAEAAQGTGVGQALLAECHRRWLASGVRLMGLETFAQSPGHVHLYSKLGYHPGWTGVQLRRTLGPAPPGRSPAAAAVQHPRLPLPDLGYLYPGFDPAAEVRATIERRTGRVFTTDRGLALLHLRNALHVNPDEGFVPLLVADDRDSFISLVEACEDAARAAGKAALAMRLPGGAAGAFRALRERGYAVGSTMLRMKSGQRLDYDRDAWYCDDWL